MFFYVFFNFLKVFFRMCIIYNQLVGLGFEWVELLLRA